MPRLAIIYLALAVVACRPTAISAVASPPSPQVRQAVEAAVTDSLFGAISRFDFAALRRAVTPDFELVEDTLRLTIDGFVGLIRPFEGKATVSYRFAQFNTRVLGNTAWTSYRNHGDFMLEGRALQYEWIETAVLLRANGAWRIDRLQSTIVRPRP
jgi:hypothetical protein